MNMVQLPVDICIVTGSVERKCVLGIWLITVNRIPMVACVVCNVLILRRSCMKTKHGLIIS